MTTIYCTSLEEALRRAEDARLLAYERKNAPQGAPTPSTVVPPDGRTVKRNTSRTQDKEDAPIVFTYSDCESALKAAKRAVRENHSLDYGRKRLNDGKECFEIKIDNKVIEQHLFKA